MAGFDEKCPYCNKDIDCRAAWIDRDYLTDFKVQCSWCNREVQIDVGMEPIFETSKPSCAMCSRAEIGDNQFYCNKCHEKILKHEGSK